MTAAASAMTTSAVALPIPGTVISSSIWRRNGAITTSIRPVNASIDAVRLSMRSRCIRARKPWCSVNRPFNASMSSGILTRRRRFARSAIASVTVRPSMRAWSIARPDTPMMSLATDDSLIPASSRSFSRRWISLDRSAVNSVRVRVRSRSRRTGGGGTGEPRSSPCAPSWAGHWASDTSVSRPGGFSACAALTGCTFNPSSSR